MRCAHSASQMMSIRRSTTWLRANVLSSFALPTSNPTRARRANPKETCARPANAHDKDAPSAQRTTWTCNRFMAYSFAVA